MMKRNMIGLVVLCSVMLAASACGKKKGDKAAKGGDQMASADSMDPMGGDDMGTARPAAAKGGKMGATGLIGTWKFDGKKVVAANEMFSKAPKDRQAKFIEMMNKASIIITKDTMTMKGMGPEETDKYKVTEDKGKVVVVESVDKKGKKEKATYTFLSANEIKVSVTDEGKAMTFFAIRQ